MDDEPAGITGKSVEDTLDRAIEELRRKVYLEGLNRDYDTLDADPNARERYRKELAAWDVTNEDGLA